MLLANLTMETIIPWSIVTNCQRHLYEVEAIVLVCFAVQIKTKRSLVRSLELKGVKFIKTYNARADRHSHIIGERKFRYARTKLAAPGHVRSGNH